MDRGQSTAFIVDRRPTLTGGEPVFTPIGFSFNDQAETEAFLNVDGAPNADPDTAGYFVAWPS